MTILAIIVIAAILWVVAIDTLSNIRKPDPVRLARKQLERYAAELGQGEEWIREHMPAMVRYFGGK